MVVKRLRDRASWAMQGDGPGAAASSGGWEEDDKDVVMVEVPYVECGGAWRLVVARGIEPKTDEERLGERDEEEWTRTNMR